jgi:segregation and condensation protein B
MIASLECLLFVSGDPVPIAELARALQADEIAVEGALRDLQITLKERGSGLQLLRIANGWQLATRPEYAEVVGRMMARGSNKLSRAAMETLAIIAYRQPITGPEIEAVRGVSASPVLKTLLERRLIQEIGRKETLGRPILYATTPDFLHYFGMPDLSRLPALESDTPTPQPVLAEAVTDGRIAAAEAPVHSDLQPGGEAGFGV